MRKVVFNTFNFAPIFLGPSLNMVQSSIDEGAETYYITCLKSFASCGFNTFRLKYMCDLCQYRFRRAAAHVEGAYRTLRIEEMFTQDDFAEADHFLAGIKTITKGTFYGKFDVGESVLSSYISKTRDRDVELAENEGVIAELSRQAIVTYLAVKRFLVEKAIDQVVLFNGRWDYYRAIFRASGELGIPCLVFENLRPGGYLETFENAFPHIIKYRQKNFDTFWNSATDTALRKAQSRAYFDKKRNRDGAIGKSYAKDQTIAYVPPEIDLSKKVLVVFNSSDDEIAAVGGDEYKNPFFADQVEGILYLAELVTRSLPDYLLVIRMHPNLRGLKFQYLEPLYRIKARYPHIVLIVPESKVDSYALIDIAFKVITFGSTIGVEANYWRKPVILLARSFYFYSDLAYIPRDKSEIMGLLVDDLSPKSIESSEKIGYYLMQGGIKAPYYNYIFNKEYYFKKHRIDHMPFLRKNYYRMLKVFKIRN